MELDRQYTDAIVSGRKVAGTQIVASFHSTVWTVLPYRSGDESSHLAAILSGGDVVQLRVRRGQHLLAIQPQSLSRAASSTDGYGLHDSEGNAAAAAAAASTLTANRTSPAHSPAAVSALPLVTVAATEAAKEGRTMWRLELVRMEWAGGELRWEQPFRLRSIETGTCLSLVDVASPHAVAAAIAAGNVRVETENPGPAQRGQVMARFRFHQRSRAVDDEESELDATASPPVLPVEAHDTVFLLRPTADTVASGDSILIGDSPAVLIHARTQMIVDLRRTYDNLHAGGGVSGGSMGLHVQRSLSISGADAAESSSLRAAAAAASAVGAATGTGTSGYSGDTAPLSTAGGSKGGAAGAASQQRPSLIVARTDRHMDDGFVFSRVEEARVQDMQILLAIRQRLAEFLRHLRSQHAAGQSVEPALVAQCTNMLQLLRQYLEGGSLTDGEEEEGDDHRPSSHQHHKADSLLGTDASPHADHAELSPALILRRQDTFCAENMMSVCSDLLDVPLTELRLVELEAESSSPLASRFLDLFRKCYRVLSAAVRGHRRNCSYFAEQGR